MRFLATATYFVFLLMVYARLNAVGPQGAPALVSMPIVAILSFAAVFVHEMGHAVTVWRLGGVVNKIAVFPFTYDLKTKKLGASPKARHADVGGFVSFAIDRIDPLRAHALVAVMGPAANFALTVVAFLGAFLLSADSLEQVILQALAALSAGMAVVNLLPHKGSDGQLIINALRKRRELAARRKSS